MKRFLGHALSVMFTGAIAVLAAPACVDNDQSIFIHHVLAPPTSRQGGACTYAPDPAGAGLFEGTLDGAVRDTYFAAMIVGNQMTARADTAQVRAESNRVHINGVIVKVTEPDGALIGEFTSTATGLVDPGLNNQTSFAVIGATLIDAPTKAKIIAGVTPQNTKLVLAIAKAFGQTLGGADVESGEFQFPIRVCSGCLVSFVGADDPATPARECNFPEQADSEGPCLPGQDELTPCFTCLDRDVCKPQ